MKKNKIIRYTNILLVVIYLFSINVFISKKEITNIFIASASLLGTVILYLINRKINKLLDNSLYIVLSLFIMMACLLGTCYDFYNINYYDDFLHMWSGLISSSVAFSIIVFFHNKQKLNVINKVFILIYVFMFSMGVASLWEILEFSLDALINTNTQAGGLTDTMIDMIDGFIGNIIMLPFIYKRLLNINK